MTDRAYEPASEDPFAQIAQGQSVAQPDQGEDDNDPFAEIAKSGGTSPPEKSSATGAFARGAERSVLPAVGSFPAIGAGAEVGAEIGLATPIPGGALIGGLVGGAAGAIGASTAISKVQNWALHQLPDSWRDKLGLSDRQEQIDEGEHPTASFLGGLVPYALTMRPGAVETAALPDNATALQRILAHPVTARLFGGAAMGGMELGQEEAEDHHVSWTKAAIATAFGMVFNRPTRFGEKITELGARPARTALGLPSPTLAQAGDAKVMGPGVTEDVFQGSHAQDPTAEATAQETARQEQATVGPIEAAPDLHETARRMNPELFAHYDDLLERQKVLQGWLDEQGPEAAPVATQHLDDANKALADIAPEVSAAYRRAAEATGAPTVAPERFPTMAAMLAAQGTEAAPAVAGTSPEAPARSIEQQRDFIRDDVSRQLVAAGRSPEEAQAAGALVAARYEARASRFNGALGTAEDLYRAEAPEIRGAKPPTAGSATPAAEPQPEPPAPTALENALPEEPAVTAPAARRGPSSRDQNTFSLLEFLAHHGGIRNDDALIADLKQSFGGKNKFVPGFGQLIRSPRGNRPGAPLSLDQARQAAVDAGYIQDAGEISRGVTQSSIEDLLQAIDKEARGERVYRIGHVAKGRAIEPGEYEHERDSFLKGLDDQVKEFGGAPLNEAERARALELYQQEGLNEAPAILERLYLEADNREIEHGAEPRPEPIAGWDTPIPEAVAREGEAAAEEKPEQPGGGTGGARSEGDRGQDPALGRITEQVRSLGTPMDIARRWEADPEGVYAQIDALFPAIKSAEDALRKKYGVKKVEDLEDAPLTKEENDFLFYGSDHTDREFWRDMSKQLQPVESLPEAAQEIAYEFSRLPDLEKSSRLSTNDELALARLQVLFSEVGRLGGNLPDVLREASQRYGAKFGDPEDAIYMVSNAADKMRRLLENKTALPAPQEVEYFQRKKGERNLVAEREAEGQQQIPGAERISDAELAQRKANEPLKPTAEQKPMDEGLFGDHGQRELFQRKYESAPGGLMGFRRFGPQKGFAESRYPHTQFVRVTLDNGDSFVDAIKGMNEPHAIERAYRNWDAKNIEPLSEAEAEKELPGIKEFAQGALGKIRIGGPKPIITLARNADASTFIHEAGHAWLEELMRDAHHPQAPGDVKADANTVLDWLGAEKPDAITTRQHEKFARGFEQYLREGVAPSPGLAAVFAKFRDWLLRIYQTLRGLGPEISPDIRSVFDRMLASEPQRTAIAPERMRPPTLADIHEADAAHTEPAEAEPAMDRVLAEYERFKQDLPGAIQNEHATAVPETEESGTASTAEPPGQADLRAAGAGQVQPDRGNAGAESPGGLGSAAAGAERGGGGAPGAEGARPSGGGERPGLAEQPDAALGDKPLAPRPAATVGPRESALVDKAGNIRLENLTNEADVRQAIRDAAQENKDFIGDRRGVVTDGQVMDLAADLGMEGAEKLVKERVRGQAFNAEQVMALRKLLIQSASDVSALMKQAEAGTDADLMAYAQAKARHQMIQGTVAQATAEAGRALRAFRNIAGTEGQADINEFLKQATGKTLFQLRQEVKLGATLDTPQKVSKFIADAQQRTFGKMVLEYWINGLISGPATHATYMIGNTLLALEKAGPETAAAAAIGRLRSALGRRGETVRMGEVAEQLRAGVRGIVPGVKAALDAFRTGATTALPGEGAAQNILRFPGTELAEPATLDEAAKLSDVLESGFSIVRGMRDGILAGGKLTEAGGGSEAPLVGLRYSHLGSIPDIELRGMNLLPLGTAIRLPSRFIAAIHSFFRAVNYSMEKNRIAYRTAANEDLTGAAFEARVGDLRQNPTDAMMEQARGEATELTLMGQGGAITQALSRLVNTPVFGFPLLKFIDPFVHISSNIINKAIIERTPLGVLSPEIRADLSGKNGNVAQDTASARMLMGTIYAVTLGGLAAEGYISGSEPADPKQAAVWRLAGNQAHSVRIGDMWYDVHRLGPLGMLMGVAADMQSVSHALSDGDLLLAGSNLQHAITQNILDESFMRGPADLIQAIEDPARYGEYYLRDQLSSFVPFSVGMAQLARAADPYSRQARTVMDTIRYKVPFLSQNLLPRRDIWGEEIANKPAVGAAGLTAIYEQKINADPVNLALLDLGIYPAQVTRKIRNVQLTDQQYDDYQRIAGRMTKMRLDAIVNSPDFATWPGHIKANVIREVIAQSREAARGMMLMKFPTIARDAVNLRMQKVSGD